ncbi:MAG: DMT family transporter [Hyphomicrobiaceae bacterium]
MAHPAFGDPLTAFPDQDDSFMAAPLPGARLGDESKGLLYGLVGVVIFGLTLPAMRIAVAELDPLFVGLGRSLIAAVIAAASLAAARAPWPKRDDLPLLAITAAGVVFGFPALSAIAMVHAPAGHGGVVLAILPLATALASVVFAGERPSLGFWLSAVAGSGAVAAFAVLDGAFARAGIGAADLALVVAVVAAAIGYATGAVLTRRLGGWQTISWTLVLSFPVLAVVVPLVSGPIAWHASTAAWSAFGYVAVMSQYLGFFFWNKGLALGGVARVGQVQLLQTFVTLGGAGLVVGEPIGPLEIGFAAVVVAIVAIGRRMRVAGYAPPRS